MNEVKHQRFICSHCGWLYKPEIGDPEHGVPPDTLFEDVPNEWVCPRCGKGIEYFDLYGKSPS